MKRTGHGEEGREEYEVTDDEWSWQVVIGLHGGFGCCRGTAPRTISTMVGFSVQWLSERSLWQV